MYLKVTILFSILLLLFETDVVLGAKLTCPVECVCDLLDNEYRRVSCENRNLIDVVNVPKEVNVFSLRGNVIHKLDDYCFENTDMVMGYYTFLIELDLSENRISDMAMYAFRGLKAMERLNLSRNRLEKIYQYQFIYNEVLLELDLSYNNFRRLKDEVFFQHKKLKVLNLSNSQIIQLYKSTFSELPLLEVLDLTGNNMVSLQISVLQPMVHLKYLSLNENNWRCNLGFNDVQQWLLLKRINFETQCGQKKSEKMIIAPSYVEQEHNIEEDLSTTWKLTNHEQKDNDKDKPLDTSIIKFDTSKSFLELYNAKFPSIWSLIIGLQVGLLIGMFMTYFWMSESCNCRRWKRRPPSFNPGAPRSSRRRHLLLNNTQTSHTDTPPIIRRQLSGIEAFPRSFSWETGPVYEPTTRLLLHDVNEMRYIPRPRAETPPPPYADCSNDEVVVRDEQNNDNIGNDATTHNEISNEVQS